MTQHPAAFRVAAEVISRLGEELITDSTQALLELIKNAYDADAGVVSVEVDTTGSYEAAGRHLTGRLRITDTGHGMDDQAIRDGWLTLSASPKRAMKSRGDKTGGGRTPLGDKGLGRLGVQRIGEVVRLRTRPTDPPGKLPAKGKATEPKIEHRVEFSFSDFGPGVMLDAVAVQWEEVPLPAAERSDEYPWPLRTPYGTVLEVIGLRDAPDWREVGRLSNELSKVINPFAGISRLAVSVKVDGQPVDLTRVGSEVREAALSRWEVSYDDRHLTVTGSLRTEHFQPNDKERRKLWDQLRLEGDLSGAVSAITQSKALLPFSPKAGKGPYVLTVKRRLDLARQGAPEEFDEDPDWFATNPCGPFAAEIDTVNLNFKVMQSAGLSLFDNQARYREWVKERSGIEVYRDGFRVAKGEDILGLAEGFTSGGSFYSLRPGNVLGYIAITAADNPQLEETTDREGLRDTPATRVFFAVLRQTRDEINKVLDESGRALNEFLDAELDRRSGTDASLDDLSEQTKVALAASANASKTVGAARDAVGEAAADLQLADSNPDLAAKLAAAADSLAGATQELDQLAVLPPLVEAIQRDHSLLTERLDETYQLIGLGLVAEALAHELTHTVARMTDRSQSARRIIDKLGIRDAELDLFVEEIDSAARSLRTQLRHLDPQLRYQITRRREVDLAELVRDAIEFHRDRLRDEPFKLSVKASGSKTVSVVPGRIMQVIDNLVLNAEYWVRQELKRGNIDTGTITMTVSGTSFSITDNGPGIAPDMVASVFEPFASGKAAGRGLGLFISRQLLAAEDATIELAPERTGQPPRTFVVDLSERATGS